MNGSRYYAPHTLMMARPENVPQYRAASIDLIPGRNGIYFVPAYAEALLDAFPRLYGPGWEGLGWFEELRALHAAGPEAQEAAFMLSLFVLEVPHSDPAALSDARRGLDMYLEQLLDAQDPAA